MMQLLGFALTGLAMIVVVFAVGAAIEILVSRRWGTRLRQPHAASQAHQPAVRNQLSGFGSGGGSQH